MKRLNLQVKTVSLPSGIRSVNPNATGTALRLAGSSFERGCGVELRVPEKVLRLRAAGMLRLEIGPASRTHSFLHRAQKVLERRKNYDTD